MFDEEMNEEFEPAVVNKNIKQGTTVTLAMLIDKGWDLTRIDDTVREGGLRYLGGRVAWVATRELYCEV